MLSRKFRIGVLLTILGFAPACAMLPAVVTDIAQIANIVIADVEKGMSPPAVIADVIAQTGSADLALIISILGSIVADPKTPAKDLPALKATLATAQVQFAAQHDAGAE